MGEDEILERNRREGGEAPGGGGGGYNASRPARPAEDSDSPDDAPAKPAKKSGGGEESGNPNTGTRHIDKGGIELTRKQREEIEKQAARRRYEELHKAGKTDEAKADLARLEEVKKRREEAAKKKADEAAAMKEKEDKAREKS